jgi:hypothetical protein
MLVHLGQLPTVCLIVHLTMIPIFYQQLITTLRPVSLLSLSLSLLPPTTDARNRISAPTWEARLAGHRHEVHGEHDAHAAVGAVGCVRTAGTWPGAAPRGGWSGAPPRRRPSGRGTVGHEHRAVVAPVPVK